MNINSIQTNLLDWYHTNKRDLPWRETSNAYHIWVSEIILQQTQVKQGYNYYLRFLEQFPSISSLANASEDQVLKQWQGLGYYSRARNMHAAAKQIVEKHNGVFPHTYNDILALKGIGQYTAAAIASFAFGLPHATLDGNVFRVIARLFAIDTPIDSTAGKKLFNTLANQLLNTEQPALHNQAMMELGAIQCKPLNPECNSCPLTHYCLARKENCVTLLPIKQSKTNISQRFFYYLLITDHHSLLLNKRSEKDIWQGLYEFPLIETKQPIEPTQLFELPEFKQLIQAPFTIKQIGPIKKHMLSHQHIYGQCIEIIPQKIHCPKPLIKIACNQLSNYPISRLLEKLIHTLSDRND